MLTRVCVYAQAGCVGVGVGVCVGVCVCVCVYVYMHTRAYFTHPREEMEPKETTKPTILNVGYPSSSFPWSLFEFGKY